MTWRRLPTAFAFASALIACNAKVRALADPEALQGQKNELDPAPRGNSTEADGETREAGPGELDAGPASDSCVGDGVSCPPLPRGDGSVTCPGCLIGDECVALDVVNPNDACQICDPERDSRGWSPDDGASCDDGLFCTTNDACSAGGCTGEPRGCEDGVDCNGVSACDEDSDICSQNVNQCGANAICDVDTDACVTTCGGCLIDGVCLSNGSEAAGNPCLVCNPTVSGTTFSAAVGKNCGSGPNDCSQQDACDSQGRCQPNNLAVNAPCGSSTSSTCDQPDSCDGSGRCLQRPLANGTTCDDGAFCSVGDQCQAGQCTSTGNRNCGSNQSCNEGLNQCQSNCNDSCVELLALGEACASDDDCGSTRCDIWHPDRDGDGYGDPDTRAGTCGSVRQSFPPAGFVANGDDCCDADGSGRDVAALIHPEQSEFFNVAQSVCRDLDPYDYDCDGAPTSDHRRAGTECADLNLNECEAGRVWAGGPGGDPPCSGFQVAFGCVATDISCLYAGELSDRFDENFCK